MDKKKEKNYKKKELESMIIFWKFLGLLKKKLKSEKKDIEKYAKKIKRKKIDKQGKNKILCRYYKMIKIGSSPKTAYVASSYEDFNIEYLKKLRNNYAKNKIKDKKNEKRKK